MQLNNFKPVPQAAVHPPTVPEVSGDAAAHQRKSAYAAMRDLEDRFHTAGIETDQVWEFIKSEHGVETRSKLTGKQWALIAGELQAARREDILFKILVDRIPDCHFRIHVFSDDPNVCVPRATEDAHLESSWFDFQAFANENQCNLTVTQGKRTKYYEPNRPPAPAAKPPKPAPVSKPVRLLRATDIDTNARGEVLNVFGDVLEVRA